ncbi:hypothetical protein FQN54_009798 [Arachnomyces sp. PD_36]|nr:hypothetical protein FQN54_009798 [Arachnomyces sp. PD_36]
MQLTTLSLIASSFFGVGQSFIQGLDADDSVLSPDWEGAYRSGAHFTTIRATSNDSEIDADFEKNWADATDNHFIRAAVHHGRPDLTSGQEQAEFFLNNGGEWVANNMTLPGILEIRASKSGDKCYGLSGNETLQFMNDWATTYHDATDKKPIVRVNLDWFEDCAGHSYWPATSYMAIFLEDGHPKPYRDMMLFYGESWLLWSNGDEYKHGGYSDVFNEDDLEYLRKFTRLGGDY